MLLPLNLIGMCSSRIQWPLSDRQKYLSENLLIDVLCRLRVKWLWYDACVFVKHGIKLLLVHPSPKFISHVKKLTQTSIYILFEEHCRVAPYKCIHSEHLFDVTKYSKLYYTPDSFRRFNLNRGLKIRGICDGLLCLYYMDYYIGRNIYIFMEPNLSKSEKAYQTCNICEASRSLWVWGLGITTKITRW